MVDTNVSLRATLARPGGWPRQLWTVFAYGAAAYQVRNLELDRVELESSQASEGGTVDFAGELLETAEQDLAKFEEMLPIGTPDDFLLAGSQSLWDEYQRKSLEIAKRLGRAITPLQAEQLRASYESICVTAPRPSYAFEVPALTTDPDDDVLVFDALRAGVEIFVSDDSDVVPDRVEGVVEYTHGDSRVHAMSTDYFFEHHCGQIDWDSVPPVTELR